MNRTEFFKFCETNNLLTGEAGTDWHDAGVKVSYVCAVIHHIEELNVVKQLIDSDLAYLVSAERKFGQAWFKYSGYGKIYANETHKVAIEMVEQFARFLASKDEIMHFSTPDIEYRDNALFKNPAFENESDEDHFKRVVELQADGWLVPRYVNQPGYWDCSDGELALSDKSIADGIWSFSYDNWEQKLILVLNEKQDD